MTRKPKPSPSSPGGRPRRKRRPLLKWPLITFTGVFALAMVVDGVDRMIPGWDEREAVRQIERAERDQAREIARAERDAARAERQAAAEAERAERQARAEAARIEEERREAIRQAACRRTLSCWANQHLAAADRACRRGIEGMARFQSRWTTRFDERRFSRFEWLNDEQRRLVYAGDRIELQNAFGVWQPHIYECAYDPETGAGIAIGMRPGRL